MIFCVLPACLALTMTAVVYSPEAPGESIQWEQLPALPDKLGFAGPFAGSYNGALLVAGGANFPGKPPWEGGLKVWHNTIFFLEREPWPGGA